MSNKILKSGKNGTTLKVEVLNDGILLTELFNRNESVFLTHKQIKKLNKISNTK